MPFLDADQILRNVLNSTEDALNVDINATVTAGAVEVAIDQSTDSIKVGDGTNLLKVNTNGSINTSSFINNFPLIQPVSGTVSLSSFPPISGSVSILNFPTVQSVSITSLPNSSVSIINFPTNQTISGSIAINSIPNSSVSVLNFPAFPTNQIISGTTSINNFPTIQTVNGSISITSIPNNSVSVLNFPSTQIISGTTSINNFPANQLVTANAGTGTFAISAASLPLPTGATTAALQTSGNASLTSIQTTSNSTATNTAAIEANQTNGTQRTLVSDQVGNLLPSGDAATRGIFTKLTDGSGNTVSSTLINSKQRLDVNLASETSSGSTAPFNTVQMGGKDSTGILRTFSTATSGEQFIKDVINVSGQNRAQSVTTSAAEALGGTTILVNRKFLTIRPTNGIIYWGFAIGVTTATGTPIYTNEVFTISVTDNVHVYVVAAQTTDVRISEGS